MYPVKRGDTLAEIGSQFGVTVEELKRFNKIDDPRSLSVGQVIKVPYYGGHIKTSATSKSATQFDPKSTPADAASVKVVHLSEAKRYIGKLLWPVPNGRLSSLFGSRWSNFHEGIDLSAKEGSPIVAAHDGRVVYRNDKIRGYGKLVVLQTPGLLTVYGHASGYNVDLGDYVKAGEVIAYVGSTGHSTGPHLHFETRVKNRDGRNAAIDPLTFFSKVKAK